MSARPRILVHRGKRRTVAAWAALVGVPADRILQRINRYGWTITRALTTPVAPRVRHDTESRRARDRARGKRLTWRRRDAGLCARCAEPSKTGRRIKITPALEEEFTQAIFDARLARPVR